MENFAFSQSLDENIAALKALFENDDSLVLRRLQSANGRRFCVVFLEGMVDSQLIGLTVVRPLSAGTIPGEWTDCQRLIDVVACDEAMVFESAADALGALMLGDSLVLMDGANGALMCNTKGGERRAVSEADSERNLRGPRDSFTESVMVNLSLIRRRLQTPELKCEMRNIGKRTRTMVCICYLEGIADAKLLGELKRRLDKIDVDGVLESNHIEEHIEDDRYSPFKTVGATERPDVAAANLLEGRVLLLVNNTPMALSLPYLFIENFQANDDYYLGPWFATLGRWLRMLSFMLSASLPGFYIAAVCYQSEMIPGTLLFNIAKATKSIPFSAVSEAMIMLIIFEILRETGARMPTKLGQALSIVGSLILGQAAVDSGIVSDSMVIVVALSGIASLMVPRLNEATMLLRFVLLGAAAAFGLYGLFFALLAVFVHLVSLSSFGVFYLEGFDATQGRHMRDILWRAPLWMMRLRPSFAKDRVRKGTER